MDNNKDRKFYWEVKDFMTKKHEPKVSTPSSSLKDSIKTVLEQNNSYVQKTFDKASEAVNIGSNFIAKNVDAQKGYNTNCAAYTKNKNVNDFSVGKMITEQQATSFGQSNRGGGSVGGPGGAGVMGGGGGGGGGSWRERNPEAYARNVAAQQELEAKRAQNLAASRRRRAEDEAFEYNEAQPKQTVAVGANVPVPGGIMPLVTTQQAPGLDMDPNDPTMPLDTPANRAKLRDFRQNKQADKVASRLQELSGKDPSSLTASETAEISLLKSMTQGSVATAGLEGKVKERLNRFSSAAQQAAQGPMPDGGNRASSVPSAQDVLDRTLGRSQADLVAQTQTKVKSEAEAKAAEQKAYEKQLAAERYAKMQDEIIQGTNMTYGQFKAQYGRDYDARSPEDSAMLVRAASNRSAFRVSPTAREYDQTATDFNRMYRGQNAELARLQGQADRRVDQAQFEYDQSFDRVVDPSSVTDGVPYTASIPKSFIRRWTEEQRQSGKKLPPGFRPDKGEYPGIGEAWKAEQARRKAEKERSLAIEPPPAVPLPQASNRISTSPTMGGTRTASASQTSPKTYRI